MANAIFVETLKKFQYSTSRIPGSLSHTHNKNIGGQGAEVHIWTSIEAKYYRIYEKTNVGSNDERNEIFMQKLRRKNLRGPNRR
jgi:hypothetical protein